MIVKGIIKSIDFNGNSCTVRMPYFETAGSAEVVSEALISNVPGIYNGYKENDVVWIAFDEGMMEAPVVIGKLYLGAAKEKNDPRGTINCETQNVSKTASIPFDTKLGTNLGDKQINTKAPFGSLESLASNLNRVDTEQGQNNRDLGNRLRSVVDAIGPDGELIYSVIEQTADKISNEVVHKKNTTDPAYPSSEKKMGWNLDLNGWDVYSETINYVILSNNTTLSIQKSLDDENNYTIFINNTDTKININNIFGEVVLEFIKKPGTIGEHTGLWNDNGQWKYIFESKAADPETEAPAEYTEMLLTEFLKKFLGNANTKVIFGKPGATATNWLEYRDSEPYRDSETGKDVTRNRVPLIMHTYEVVPDYTDISVGWNVFVDITEVGHELIYKIWYYDGTTPINTSTPTITGILSAELLFNTEKQNPTQLPSGRQWSLLTRYKIKGSGNEFHAPMNLVRSTVSDTVNTLVGINRNGLYVNGTVAAKRGHIGEFIIGSSHPCTELNESASGIFSRNYIKRFEDIPAKDQKGVYVGTDGIKIGNNFSVDANGKVKGSGFEITLDTTATKELQIVNKNYQDGNILISNVLANLKDNTHTHELVPVTTSETNLTTVSLTTDEDNIVNKDTYIYTLKCARTDTYSALILPSFFPNTGQLIATEKLYEPWTFSFKISKLTFNTIFGGADPDTAKIFIFLGVVDPEAKKFDTIPSQYLWYKNYSSCNDYTRATTDTSPKVTGLQVPDFNADTNKVRQALYYTKPTKDGYHTATADPDCSAPIDDYNNTSIGFLWTDGTDERINFTNSTIGTWKPAGTWNPAVFGATRYFSSCYSSYETYYYAYLVASITSHDSQYIEDVGDQNYVKFSVTLDKRYYNLYNSLPDLRFGICYFNTSNIAHTLDIKEFKFEKSKIASDYTISARDDRANTAQTKTISMQFSWDKISGWNTSLPSRFDFEDTSGVRESYLIRKNDIVIIRGTVADSEGQDREYTICYTEDKNEGDLGGIPQYIYVTPKNSSLTSTSETIYKYRTNNSKTIPPAYNTDTEKAKWDSTFIEPTPPDTGRYTWGISVTKITTTDNQTGSSTTETIWGTNPQILASYEGLLSILEDSTTGVALISRDEHNNYHLIADKINGSLQDTVTIGGDHGFTIKPSQKVTNNNETTYTPASIYNNISIFSDNTKTNGVYVGTDGIRLGKNFTVDNTGHVEASSLTIQQSQVSGLAGALDNAAATGAATGAANAVSTIDGRGYQTATQVTTITKDTIQTEHLVAQNLHVNAANIDGSVTAKKIEVKSGSDTVLLADADAPGNTYVGGFNVATDYLSTGPTSLTDNTNEGLYLSGGGIVFNKSTNAGHAELTTAATGVPQLKLDWSVGSTYLNPLSYSTVINRTFQATIGGTSYSGTFKDVCEFKPINNASRSDNGYIIEVKHTNTSGTLPGSLLRLKADQGKLEGTWSSESAIVNTSDINLKNSIEALNNSYEIIFDNLKPVRFKYNSGTSNRYHTGLIAQELQEAINKAKLTEKDFAALVTVDNYMGIRYEELIALNIDQIQKLKKRVVELEEKLNKIEKGE